MAVAVTQDDNSTRFAAAYTHHGGNNNTVLDTNVNSFTNPNASGLTSKWQPNIPPFALGSGVYVNTNGRWLMDPVNRAVSRFVVVNADIVDVYVGINAVQSGQWDVDSGLTLASGQSYEFGADNGQPIRNVWAISSNGDRLIQGYATDYPSWVG